MSWLYASLGSAHIKSVAVSPDGSRVVAGGRAGVQVWDLATGTPLWDSRLRRQGWVHSVAVTPDGTRVVSSDDVDGVWVRDLTTGRQLGEPWRGRLFAVTPDSMRVVQGAAGGQLQVWDLATGTPIGDPWIGHEGPVWSVAVTPDGTRAVSGGRDGTLRVTDMATGTPLGDPWIGHWNWVRSVAVTPDGSGVVSAGTERGTESWSRPPSLRLWDLATGTQVRDPWLRQGDAVNAVTVTRDGSRVVSGGYGGVRVLKLPTGALLGRLSLGYQDCASVAVTQDGSRVVFGGSAGVGVWDWETAGDTLLEDSPSR